ASGYVSDLPSFPTRRSSDLHAGARKDLRDKRDPVERIEPLGAVKGLAGPLRFTQHVPDQAKNSPGHGDIRIEMDRPLRKGHSLRSEEHTSELQSQSNLVCRL